MNDPFNNFDDAQDFHDRMSQNKAYDDVQRIIHEEPEFSLVDDVGEQEDLSQYKSELDALNVPVDEAEAEVLAEQENLVDKRKLAEHE